MFEVSEENFLTLPHMAAKRKSTKTEKTDEFSLFRNSKLSLLRHPVDEFEKYFRGLVNLSMGMRMCSLFTLDTVIF